MPPAGMSPGPEGTYLTRARSLCARGEALGGRLVAWSAALLAVAWDPDSIEEAVLLATSLREEALQPERAWAGGMSEGELEPLAPDGQRMALAWGEALLSAASLARIAGAGEVVVDGDLRALRAGQLSLLGARAATDAGRRVRGWRLDLARPWKRSVDDARVAGVDPTDRDIVLPPQDDAGPIRGPTASEPDLLASTQETPAVEPGDSPAPPPASERRTGGLGERVRKLADRDASTDPREALAELRRERARVEGAPPATRCQASLALAMALGIAGQVEEALLEALDALARAREAQDAKAAHACRALLSKLYAAAGYADHAAALLK